MKASDKIYVNFPFGEEYPWRGPMVTDQGLNQHDTTYIRKDALLEWAVEKQEQMKIEAGGCSNMLAAGKFLAFEEIIEKLESL